MDDIFALLTAINAEFAKLHPECADPARAAGLCATTSREYIGFLQARGIHAELRQWPGHVWVRIPALFLEIDWTSRQFWPDDPWPLIRQIVSLDDREAQGVAVETMPATPLAADGEATAAAS